MIKRGPVDMLVLALGEPIFNGSILRELEKQSAANVIRVLDAMILFKASDGKCWSVDLEDLPEKDLEALRPQATCTCSELCWLWGSIS